MGELLKPSSTSIGDCDDDIMAARGRGVASTTTKEGGEGEDTGEEKECTEGSSRGATRRPCCWSSSCVFLCFSVTPCGCRGRLLLEFGFGGPRNSRHHS